MKTLIDGYKRTTLIKDIPVMKITPGGGSKILINKKTVIIIATIIIAVIIAFVVYQKLNKKTS